VPGPLIVVLRQISIPILMIISILVLKRKYRVRHYIGAVIILGGIILALWPQLSHIKDAGPVWAILLIIGSSFTLSVATLYMEHSLQNYVRKYCFMTDSSGTGDLCYVDLDQSF
jgi:drug/metabolite transporter (DMT)-like permease